MIDADAMITGVLIRANYREPVYLEATHMKRKLNPIDWAFLQAESPERLAHVAGLWIFQLPRGYRKKVF